MRHHDKKKADINHIVAKIIQLNSSQSNLKFTERGKISDNHAADCLKSIVISNAQLAIVFQELNRRNIDIYLNTISFIGFDFIELPKNINQVLNNVKYCMFINCPNLSSVGSAVIQLPSLEVLICRKCPSLKSISSLKSLSSNSSLCNLAFKECGLEVTSDNEWQKGFHAIGRTKSNTFVLTITNCPRLKSLPASLKYLTKSEYVQIVLDSNTELNQLPSTIGDLKSLKMLRVHHCPMLQVLPWTLRRVTNCAISLKGNENLINDICSKQMIGSNHSSGYAFKIKSNDSIRYFRYHERRFFFGILKLAIYLIRWRKQVINRLYQPGGSGFLKLKSNFELLAIQRSNLEIPIQYVTESST